MKVVKKSSILVERCEKKPLSIMFFMFVCGEGSIRDKALSLPCKKMFEIKD
jgi:hypothetical protein